MKFPRLNSMTVSGRLTRDGELKFLPNGTAVFGFSIAIDDGYFDKQPNQWVNQPVFMDVAVWSKQGEKLANEVKKGSPVIVEGKLKQRAYTTQDGQNRRVTEIVANRVHCLEYSEDKSEETGNKQQQSANAKPEPKTYNQEEVPF
jgi:single-strand DNA-binding protein